MTGKLYLVPAPLDFGCEPPLPAIADALPLGTLQHMARLQHWVCENAKTTRALLKRVDAVVPLAQPIQQLHISEIPREWHKKGDHHLPPDIATAKSLLAAALQGQDMALSSEAGVPAVADPGSSLVRAAHILGVPVVPLVGPSSIVLALAASGLNGQGFVFHGYLPQDVQARAQRLQELEKAAHKTGQSQWWIETPYRNAATLQTMLKVLQPNTLVSIASGLTLEQMQINTNTVAILRQQNCQYGEKLPAVFGLGKGA